MDTPGAKRSQPLLAILSNLNCAPVHVAAQVHEPYALATFRAFKDAGARLAGIGCGEQRRGSIVYLVTVAT